MGALTAFSGMSVLRSSYLGQVHVAYHVHSIMWNMQRPLPFSKLLNGKITEGMEKTTVNMLLALASIPFHHIAFYQCISKSEKDKLVYIFALTWHLT